MYCSTCGANVARGLSYCNHCGAKLGAATGDGVSESPEVKPELLVSAMAGVFILGLVAIAVLIGVLRRVAGFDLPFLLVTIMFSFLMMLIVEGTFMRLLFRRRRGAGGAGRAALSKGQATKELDAAQARALAEPVPSVTEGTTRTLEHVYNERTPK